MSMRDIPMYRISSTHRSLAVHASYAGAFYVLSGISANPAGFRNVSTSNTA